MTITDEHRSVRSSLRVHTYIAPHDRLITTPFVVVTASALAMFMYIGTLLPLVPLYIEGPLDGGEFGVGLNAAVFAGAAICARPVLGRLADRYGRRRVMVGGAVVAAIGGFGMSQADTLGALLGFRIFTGIGEAAVFVGAATLIADLSPRERRAEGASYFSVAVFGGLGLGPVFGEWMLAGDQFERTFIAAGVFALLAMTIAMFVPAFVVSPDSGADGGAGGADGSDGEDSHAVEERGWPQLVHPAAVAPGVVLALGVGGLTSFFLFVPDYSRELGLGSSGGLFFVYAALTLVIRVVGARWPERLGPRRAVTIALGAMAAGLVVVGLVPTQAALWVAAVFVGFGIAFNYPSLMALTVNRVSDRERARAISSFTMFFEIGSAVSGLAVGAVAQLIDERVGFLLGAALCLVGVVVLRTVVVPAGTPEADGRRDPRAPTLDRATVRPHSSADDPNSARPDDIDAPSPRPVAGN